ncbi:MAG: hypothetical protein ACLP36_10625 [Acidimicrobiales bacterium]
MARWGTVVPAWWRDAALAGWASADPTKRLATALARYLGDPAEHVAR